MRKNKLKESFKAGEFVVGCYNHIPSPHITEIIGETGFDFVIIDMEHSPMTLETMEHMVRAAQTTPVTPIVRPKTNDPSLIATALDCGAGGVLIPHIESGTQAEQAVRSALYPPVGDRSVCQSVRAAGYDPVDKPAYFAEANEQVSVHLLVEGVGGIENFEEIISVPGVDVIHLGPADLSAAVGVPGEYEHKLVIDKITELASLARDKGVNVSTIAWGFQQITLWREIGINSVVFGSDAAWIPWAFRRNWKKMQLQLQAETT